MDIQLTKFQLFLECTKRGISVIPDGNYKRKELIEKLADHTIEGYEKDCLYISENDRLRWQIESPMLCFLFNKLKKTEKENVLYGNDWVAEQKFNGVRCFVIYSPEDGWKIYSRKLNPYSFLPFNWTDRIELIKNGKVTHPARTPRISDHPLIFDAEIIMKNLAVDNFLWDTYSIATSDRLNTAEAVLQLDECQAVDIQRAFSPFRIILFDLLGKNIHEAVSTPYKERRKRLESTVKSIEEKAPDLPFELSPSWKNRIALYKLILETGREGIILKNTSSCYEASTSRKRNGWVKLKSSMGYRIDSHNKLVLEDFR